MLLREDLEKREIEMLSERACKSAFAGKRKVDEPKCKIRTDFQRDRDRIIHSKAFRRLMHKTQVFLSPEGDHYRTRLTHTLEVSQVARTIARALNLNEDLTEAIAMGHDMGHTPFGHNGEFELNKVYGHFKHNEQSLRVVQVIEVVNSKHGMNLTPEVEDGILHHTGTVRAKTLEGQIVALSDRIAYINHDIDDAIRSGVISSSDLPRECIELFGDTHRKRINNMVENVVENSENSEYIRMDDEYTKRLLELRSFMFASVYNSRKVKKEELTNKVSEAISILYKYYISNPEKLPEDYKFILKRDGINEAAKDYVAGMTDRFAFKKYEEILAGN